MKKNRSDFQAGIQENDPERAREAAEKLLNTFQELQKARTEVLGQAVTLEEVEREAFSESLLPIVQEGQVEAFLSNLSRIDSGEDGVRQMIGLIQTWLGQALAETSEPVLSFDKPVEIAGNGDTDGKRLAEPFAYNGVLPFKALLDKETGIPVGRSKSLDETNSATVSLDDGLIMEVHELFRREFDGERNSSYGDADKTIEMTLKEGAVVRELADREDQFEAMARLFDSRVGAASHLMSINGLAITAKNAAKMLLPGDWIPDSEGVVQFEEYTGGTVITYSFEAKPNGFSPDGRTRGLSDPVRSMCRISVSCRFTKEGAVELHNLGLADIGLVPPGWKDGNLGDRARQGSGSMGAIRLPQNGRGVDPVVSSPKGKRRDGSTRIVRPEAALKDLGERIMLAEDKAKESKQFSDWEAVIRLLWARGCKYQSLNQDTKARLDFRKVREILQKLADENTDLSLIVELTASLDDSELFYQRSINTDEEEGKKKGKERTSVQDRENQED